MSITLYLEENGIRQADLARTVGCDRGHLNNIIAGRAKASNLLALRIWRATGCKLGALEALTDEDCAQLERLSGAVREAANTSEGQAA